MNNWLAKILQEHKAFSVKHSLLLCGFLSTSLYAYLCLQSQGFGQADFANLAITVFFAAILSFFACYHLHLHHVQILYGANLSEAKLLFYILAFAVLFRAIGLFTFPILEDDFYRYLWDGFLFVEQGNPYGVPPSDYFSIETIPETFQDILGNINYPGIATVYGPVCQWIFALAYYIAPGELWPLKLLILLADLLLLMVIVLLMRAYSIKIHYLLLYAWCPLVLIEFVITLHPDIIAALFMFTALLAVQRKALVLSAVFFALAVSTKIFAVLLIPLVFRFKWKPWLVFCLVMVLIAWPFGLLQAWLPEGLKAMATQWYFNAPMYSLLSFLSFTNAKIILLLCFSLIYLFVWLKKSWILESNILRGDLIFALFLLILPALNAWYLIFLLPFGVFYISRTVWTASILVFLSYALMPEAEGLKNTLILLLEFGVLALVFLWDMKNKPDKNQAYIDSIFV